MGTPVVRSIWRFIVLFGMLLSTCLIAAPAAAGEGAPFEPNNSILDATGPLLIGQTYTETLETAGDRDFFYFYVTSPTALPVSFTIKNLAGGAPLSDIDATIVDTSSTPISVQAYIRKGEERALSATLKPQKYYLELAPNDGFGDAYSVTPTGRQGAIGPYAVIQARCKSASDDSKAADSRLFKARLKFQRATGRVLRATYSGPKARRTARAVRRKAKGRVTAERRKVKAAAKSKALWCSIV
jgi:hypothetical protein